MLRTLGFCCRSQKNSSAVECGYYGRPRILDIYDRSVRGWASNRNLSDPRAFASNIGKIAVVLARALALTLFVVRSKARPSLGVSHGSRSATLAAWFLRISSVTLDDYEYSYQGFARFASSILVPSAIPPVEWGNNSRKVRGYPGFKEMIYLAGRDLSNTSGFLSAEDRKKVVVVFRPDSPVAHYWSERSESFRRKILDHLAASGEHNSLRISENACPGKGNCRVLPRTQN